MQVHNHSNRIICIGGGISVILYIAVRSLKSASEIVRYAKWGLFGLTILLAFLSFFFRLLSRDLSEDTPPDCSLSFSFKTIADLITDTLSLFGRHSLLLILINYFDKPFFILYRDYGRIFPILHRILIDLALAELIVLTLVRIISWFFKEPSSRWKINPFAGAHSDICYLNKWAPLLSICFYISFGFFLFYRFLNTTMFQYEIRNESLFTRSSRLCTNLLILLAVFETAQSKKKSVFFLQQFILIVGVLHYLYGGNRKLILCMCLLIVASSRKDFKTIARIYIAENLLTLFIMLVGTSSGAITDLVFYNGLDTTVPRHALGCVSPTDYSAQLLYLALVWCMLRPAGKKLTNCLDYPAFAAAFLVAWKLNVARSNSFWLLLLIIGTALHQFFPELLRSIYDKTVHLCKGIAYIFAGSFLWLFTYSLSQCLTMTGDPLLFETFLIKFMDFWSIRWRIYYGYLALKSTPVTLLGSKFKENGNGGVLEKPENYSFLDISYIRVLVTGGILVTVILLGIFTVFQFRHVKHEQFYLFFLLLLVSFNCFFEHHIFDIAYDLFPLMTFCSLQSIYKRTSPKTVSQLPH